MPGQDPGGHGADDHQQENGGNGGEDAVLQTHQELLIFRNDPEVVIQGGVLGPCQMVDGDLVLILDGVDHTDVEGDQGDNDQGDADQLFQGGQDSCPAVLPLQDLIAGVFLGCGCHASTSLFLKK